MNCQEIRRYLSDYSEGGLKKEIYKEVEWHIQRCKRCAQELFEIKELLNIAGRMDRIKASADFEKRLKRRIALDTIPQNRRIPSLDFLSGLFHSGSWLKHVAVTLVIFLVLFIRGNTLTNRLLTDTHKEVLRLNREILAMRHIIRSEIYLPQEMERLYKEALFYKQSRKFDEAKKLFQEITVKCPYKDISRKAGEELRDMPLEELNGI